MKIIKIYALFIVSAAIILVASITSFAANFTVTNTNDGGAGSLRQAILDANAAGTNDVIGFDSGVFGSPKTITLTTGELVINSNGNLTINGPGANLLSISGNDASRVFNVSATTSTLTATINNLTVRNGYKCASNFAGGGLAVNDSGTLLVTLNLESVIFTENNVGCGGGGGGLQVIRNGSLNINNTIFRNNVASQGGGIDCGSGAGDCISVNISNTLFEGNSAGTAGGGGGGFKCCGTSTPVTTPINIENSAFINNTAGRNGSAVRESNQGTFFWKNVTFAYNKATDTGPALGLQSGSHTFENVTIAYNTTATSATAGGVQDTGNTGFVRFRNSIVAKNRNANGESDLDFEGVTLNSLGYNIFGVLLGSTTVSGNTTGNQIGVDPLLDVIPRNNGGITKNLALRPGSPAIDLGDPGNFLATDQRGIARPVDGDGNGSALPDIGAFEKRTIDIVPAQTFDFDGDFKSDVSIFRPAVGEWWIHRSSDGIVPAFQFGISSDKIVPADFTGDGKTDYAVWRPSSGEWFILRSEDNSFYSFPFGASGDIPAPADFDGDGTDDVAIFRPSDATWYIIRSSDNGTTITTFGANGDQPVAADYDGDGFADVAIFRPSTGAWWINRSTAGGIVTNFGTSSDKTVQADYTGDGKADVAFYRPSTGEWFILRSEDSSFYSIPFGASGDVAAPGDYDGDGATDYAVFRASNATWYVQQSTAGFAAVTFGAAGDQPVPNAFVR